MMAPKTAEQRIQKQNVDYKQVQLFRQNLMRYEDINSFGRRILDREAARQQVPPSQQRTPTSLNLFSITAAP